MIGEHYILLFDNDLISSSILTLSLKKLEPRNVVYQVSTTKNAIDLVEKTALFQKEYSSIKSEASLIVDLNMDNNRGYYFLYTLYGLQLPCNFRVYTVKSNHRERFILPYFPEGVFTGELQKPLDYNQIEETFLFKANKTSY